MRLLVVISLLLLIGCVEPQPHDVSSSLSFDLMEKSCLVNSADAIIYGEYRVELHQADLVHPKWRVVKGGKTLVVGDMISCLREAFKLWEGGKS